MVLFFVPKWQCAGPFAVYIMQYWMYSTILQVELMGQSIFEYTHPCDHEEVTDIFSKHHGKKENHSEESHVFFMRMKSTLTSKGKNVNLKSASYKVRAKNINLISALYKVRAKNVNLKSA